MHQQREKKNQGGICFPRINYSSSMSCLLLRVMADQSIRHKDSQVSCIRLGTKLHKTYAATSNIMPEAHNRCTLPSRAVWGVQSVFLVLAWSIDVINYHKRSRTSRLHSIIERPPRIGSAPVRPPWQTLAGTSGQDLRPSCLRAGALGDLCLP